MGSTLGGYNSFVSPDADIVQAHPANQPFTNVGQLGQLFYTNTYGPLPRMHVTEPELRINLADASYQQLFKYLTVMDPPYHNTIDPNEVRIKGRININTAPWYVIAQLPWVSYQSWDLARSIVAYRDKTNVPGLVDYSGRAGLPGFRSIGELMTDANNSNIGYYQGRTIPPGLLTPPDCNSGAGDAFEMRDVIFDRISNLVTVRSDVFTAYILVRIGADGPQKRVIAIFDRSGVIPAAGGYTGKVKLLAVYPVPDPR